METTKQIFRMYNFKLLCAILDEDFGVIYCTSVKSPDEEIINLPIKK